MSNALHVTRGHLTCIINSNVELRSRSNDPEARFLAEQGNLQHISLTLGVIFTITLPIHNITV
jgi:hypothetical protein